MKKLILLLTLTMMFGQTKWESREFVVEFTDLEVKTIEDITGFELDYFLFQTVSISPIIQYNYIHTLNCKYGNTVFGGTAFYEWENYDYIDYHQAYNSQNVCSSGELQFNTYDGAVITLSILITAPFPVEDTGYIEDGFDYCVEPGANLMSYPCDSAVALLDAIPSDALSQFEGIIGAGSAATNLNGTWVGSITNLTPGAGYWIKSNSALCFNYDCSEN